MSTPSQKPKRQRFDRKFMTSSPSQESVSDAGANDRGAGCVWRAPMCNERLR
jgi:hypothetical protein